MANQFVQHIIDKLKQDFGSLKKIGDGNSLFEIASNGALIYFRYSKLTAKSKMMSGFYGLRHEDIKLLSGRNAFICFVWDTYDESVFIPFKDFEYSFGLFVPKGLIPTGATPCLRTGSAA